MAGCELRRFTDDDIPFLRAVYAATRAAEMELVSWTDEQKDAFLDMQFKAQHTHYLAHFAQAQFDIVERAGQSIGRLYVDRRPDTLHVLDIALLPEQRSQGIGTALMHALMDEAARTSGRVTLYVEHFNPALLWYLRLGFRVVDQGEVYALMEWTAQ